MSVAKIEMCTPDIAIDHARERAQTGQHARLMSVLVLALFLFGTALAHAAGPPPAKVDDDADTYFGTRIADPYRWMEREPDLFAAWLHAQNAYTREVLQRIPGRGVLLKEISALEAANDHVSGAVFTGDRWFYSKLRPEDDVAKIYMRDLKGRERVVIDPTRFDLGSARATISFWRPSWDGHYIAYGIALGGKEVGFLRVTDVRRGVDLPERIDGVYYANPAWLPDNSGFVYTRLAGNSGTGQLTRPVLILHKLGRAPERERPLLGVGIRSRVPVPVGRFVSAFTAPASAEMLVVVRAGLLTDNLALFSAPLAKLAGTHTPWRRLAAEADQVRSFEVHGRDLYLTIARHDASHDVVRTSLAAPDLAHAAVLVSERNGLIVDIEGASDALYVWAVEGGSSIVLRLPWTRGPTPPAAHPLPLPEFTGITSFSARPTVPGIVFAAQSWLRAPAIFRFDPAQGGLADTKLQPPAPTSFADIDAVEATVPASGSAGVPLTVMLKRGTALDGSHPVLLYGYGAYGDIRAPAFDPARRALFDHGAIYAVAHIRGGGEYGDKWHEAGMLAQKPNSISDFIAAADYLVAKGYTAPRLLAGEGISAGGIVIGGAIAARPDLFAAALIGVGLDNALRLEEIPIGAFNTGEFGTVATPQGFRMLEAIDAYHHIADGVRYPAVLLWTGLNDARVSPWQTGKMAARLQAASASGKPVLLRLEDEGGHLGGSSKALLEASLADQFAFLLWQAGIPEFQPPVHD